jgi:tungstate transport system permease protein
MWEGFLEAVRLVISLDPYLMQIIFLSLQVSGGAILISTALGVPLGAYLGMKAERKTRFVSKVIYTLMGMPPVVGGLLFYLLLSRRGPLGVLGLLHSPTAMIIAQVFLSLPIVIGLTLVGIRSRGGAVEETARTLGAGSLLTAWTVIREARVSIFGAVVTGFGGNIQGHTRVMTTAIVLETSRGNYEFAIGLGLVLLALSFGINSLLYTFQKGGEGHL